MLARKNRIPKSEFPSPKDRGIRFLSTLFSGTIYPSIGGKRVSVVVSKKISNKAAVRNRLKRHFYAATELFLGKLKDGVTIVVYPKKEAINKEFLIIKGALGEEFKKAKILP